MSPILYVLTTNGLLFLLSISGFLEILILMIGCYFPLNHPTPMEQEG